MTKLNIHREPHRRAQELLAADLIHSLRLIIKGESKLLEMAKISRTQSIGKIV